MSEPRTIRDPIHKFIKLNEQEAEIIDSEAYQRLRYLRQLAFAYLVYPGATHTRFEHSLGVCHVAGLMADRLKLDPDEKKLIRLAALLHDLGHGPFSHVSEEALERYADRSKLPAQTHKIHELITKNLIREDRQIEKVLAHAECDRVIRILETGHGEPVLRSVLSGPLDADKQDYLLRDSYYCGVQYGIFDLPQLHEILCKVGDPVAGDLLMIHPDGVHTLEQFVLAKYYLTTQVIRHRIRLITDQMLIRAITLGIDADKIDELHALYSYDGTSDFIRRYAEWGDTRLLQTFAGDQFHGGISHFLFSGLLNRRLLKMVYRAPITDLAPDSRQVLRSIGRPANSELRKKLESAVSESVRAHAATTPTPGNDPSQFIILHSYTLKSVKEESSNDEASIMVNDSRPIPFEEASALFQSIDRTLSESFVEVYAPVEYDTPFDRRTIKNKLHEPITAILSGAAQ